MLDIPNSTRVITTITFFLYLIVVAGIGFYAKKSLEKSKVDKFVNDFYTGGRLMGGLVVGMMVSASICSAGTFIGGPGLGYGMGLTWTLAIYSSVLMNFFMLGLVGKKVGIISRRINAVSYVSLIKHRFNNNKFVGIVGPLSIVVFLTAYVASQFIGGARLLEMMTGMNYKLGLIIFGIVVAIYTALGGIKGVSLTITFQGFVMTFATIFLLIGVITHIKGNLGGLEAEFSNLAKTEPNMLTPWSWNPLYQLSLFFMYGIGVIGYPHSVQGTFTYKNTQSLHKAIIVGIIFVTFWQGIMTFMGPAAKLITTNLEVADHVTPFLAIKTLPPWLAGITIAGAVGAIQSTVGAMLIIVSSSIVKDLYNDYINPDANSEKLKTVTRSVTVSIIVLVVIMAMFPPNFLQIIINFALGGLVATFFVPLLFGIYWIKANQFGAVSAMIGGFGYYILSSYFPALKLGMHAVGPATILSLILMIGISFITPKTPKGIILTWFSKDYPQIN